MCDHNRLERLLGNFYRCVDCGAVVDILFSREVSLPETVLLTSAMIEASGKTPEEASEFLDFSMGLLGGQCVEDLHSYLGIPPGGVQDTVEPDADPLDPPDSTITTPSVEMPVEAEITPSERPVETASGTETGEKDLLLQLLKSKYVGLGSIKGSTGEG